LLAIGVENRSDLEIRWCRNLRVGDIPLGESIMKIVGSPCGLMSNDEEETSLFHRTGPQTLVKADVESVQY